MRKKRFRERIRATALQLLFFFSRYYEQTNDFPKPSGFSNSPKRPIIKLSAIHSTIDGQNEFVNSLVALSCYLQALIISKKNISLT